MRYNTMIRVFQLFCKLNFQIVSAESLYNKFMDEIDPKKHSCPWCNTKTPDWKDHANYERWLISFEGGVAVTYRLEVSRYKCPSCGHTHAILPDSIIPYQCYSFLFIIAVMRDYYTRTLTMADICTKYNISISTLYSWKELFLRHKKLWLGLLEDAYTSSLDFLNSFYDTSFRYDLEEFFQIVRISFLQGASQMKKAHPAPV
jgi:transposase-like protein